MRPTKRTLGFALISRPPPAAPRAGRRSPRSRSRATDGFAAGGETSRSPGSATIRPIAAASSSGRPGATSRPFSPSRTTSGTPPTAVETTGTPTDSASTAECGRFSQSLESRAASAPATVRSASSRDSAPRNEIRSPRARGGHRAGRGARARARRRRATSRASGTRAIASIAVPSAFCRVSRPTKTNVPGSSSLALDVARGRGRVREHVQPVAAESPAGCDLGEIRAGDDDRPRARAALASAAPSRRRTAGVDASWNSSSEPRKRP